MDKQSIQAAAKAGIPIFIGYFPAAVAFGVLAKTCGVSLLETLMFSSVVFAGASQFIALNLLMTGMGPVGIVLTTLLVNSRHILMSTYLSTRIKEKTRAWYLPIAFWVTDESFSVFAFTREKLTRTFVLGVEVISYTGWCTGTLAGFLLGGFMPPVLTQSMGVALYALLLAILMPEIKTSLRSLFLVLASGGLHWTLGYFEIIPKGWRIIVCILVIAGVGALLSVSWPQKEDVHGNA